MDKKELTYNVGMNIRKYRLNADLSQESLALSAELSPAYLGRLERGEKCPSIDTLYKISEALNISVCDLLIFNTSDTYPASEITRRIEKALEKVPKSKIVSIVKIIEDITKVSE